MQYSSNLAPKSSINDIQKAAQIFSKKFFKAETCTETIKYFQEIRTLLRLENDHGFQNFTLRLYNILTTKAEKHLSSQVKNFFKDFIVKYSSNVVYRDETISTPLPRTSHPPDASIFKSPGKIFSAKFKNSSSFNDLPRACSDTYSLIIGAGPIGLKYAIELSILGGKVTILEKRKIFAQRNNLLHLWKAAIDDLKRMGVKRIHPLLCTGSINHIEIKTLQIVLLKIALISGCQILTGYEYINAQDPGNDINRYWKPRCQPYLPSNCLVKDRIDQLIGADGAKTCVTGFEMKHFKGTKIAIGITANFENLNLQRDKDSQEIPGTVR